MPNITQDKIDEALDDLKRWETKARVTKNDEALKSVENIQDVIKGLTGRK